MSLRYAYIIYQRSISLGRSYNLSDLLKEYTFGDSNARVGIERVLTCVTSYIDAIYCSEYLPALQLAVNASEPLIGISTLSRKPRKLRKLLYQRLASCIGPPCFGGRPDRVQVALSAADFPYDLVRRCLDWCTGVAAAHCLPCTPVAGAQVFEHVLSLVGIDQMCRRSMKHFHLQKMLVVVPSRPCCLCTFYMQRTQAFCVFKNEFLLE